MSHPNIPKSEQVFNYNLAGFVAQIIEDDNLCFDDLARISDAWVSEHFSSPIEQILFAELLFLNNGYVMVAFDQAPDVHKNTNPVEFSRHIKIGVYEADFLITTTRGEKKECVVIECDGHDFHEKTKQQAAHDKKRDRWFLRNGYKVLRFTGSEIYNDVASCGEEINSILEDIYEDLYFSEIFGKAERCTKKGAK